MIFVVRVVGDCRCEERQLWQRAGSLFYVPHFRGYVFADYTGTPRRRDNRPYVFVDCPFCGGSLHTED